MNFRYEKIDKLIPYERNARKHTDAQIDKIAKSIEELGFINPIIIDENNRIMAGHGRVEASKNLA
ncbi:MAG: ParB N-terminal domain-containing protein [Clostridia bacterium]|nr:ParB N-terminal domain-containing protein [Clostridia bacterium]